ncbi:MAG: outer membrane protein transport protein [Myxococcus sp.]|nr:outer membrane protein transport protein [Myxococcus sp.]
MPRLLVSCLFVVAASTAHGSGFYFGDNGARAMVQGGAFTAQADDLSAMQHNPAGLTQVRGLSLLVDGNFMNNEVTFWRQDPGWNPNAPSNLMEKVARTGSNISPGGTVFISPMFGASYGFDLFGRAFTVALGFYVPPAVGLNEYPVPDYTKDSTGKYNRNPKRFSPNRYMLVKQDIIIAFPTLAIAYDFHPMVQAGVSLQLVTSHFDFNQAVYSGLTDPTKSSEEDASFDSVVRANLDGLVGFTAVAGVMVRPTSALSFGASLRPPVPIRARGKLTFDLGETPRSLNTTVMGDEGQLEFTMPLEVRVGARYSPSKTWGVNADFVYQGWNSLDALTLTPLGVTLAIGSAAPTPVAPFKVPKNWVGTFSGRLGGSYRPWKWTSFSAGVWYETSAQPSPYFALDFPHPSRLFLTGGVTGHLGPIELIAGFVYTPTTTLNITDSNQRQGSTGGTDINTMMPLQGGVVGNGQYTVGGWIVSLGLRGNLLFDAPKPAPAPVEPPAPAPAPAPVESVPAAT